MPRFSRMQRCCWSTGKAGSCLWPRAHLKNPKPTFQNGNVQMTVGKENSLVAHSHRAAYGASHSKWEILTYQYEMSAGTLQNIQLRISETLITLRSKSKMSALCINVSKMRTPKCLFSACFCVIESIMPTALWTCYVVFTNYHIVCWYFLLLANHAKDNSSCFSDLLPTRNWNAVNLVRPLF